MFQTIFGTADDDVFLFASTGVQEVVFAGGGNDVIDESSVFVWTTDDVYSGGAGDDLITSRSGADLVRGGRGDDVVHLFGTVPAEAHGGKGHDTIYLHLTDGRNHPDGASGSFEDHDIPHHIKGFEEIVYL